MLLDGPEAIREYENELDGVKRVFGDTVAGQGGGGEDL
jgi:hypothetical protein